MAWPFSQILYPYSSYFESVMEKTKTKWLQGTHKVAEGNMKDGAGNY
jgi:hypothetical protein